MATSTTIVVVLPHIEQPRSSVFVAVVAGMTFFLASLRHTLSRTDEGRFLANVVTAGGAVYAVGLMLMAALTVALVDAAATTWRVRCRASGNDLWVPVVVRMSDPEQNESAAMACVVATVASSGNPA